MNRFWARMARVFKLTPSAARLEKLLSQFPPAAGTNFISHIDGEKQAALNDSAPSQRAEDELAPIDVRQWLIEPDAEGLARISL